MKYESMSEEERQKLKAQVREWRENWKVINEITLEEKRSETPRERFRGMISLLYFLQKNGLWKEREDDLEFHLRWQRLRERALEPERRI